MSQTTVPLSFLTVNGSGLPTKPRSASSKSFRLLKSRYCCTARFAAFVASVAGLGWVCARAASGRLRAAVRTIACFIFSLLRGKGILASMDSVADGLQQAFACERLEQTFRPFRVRCVWAEFPAAGDEDRR